jgi:hypothetical protein
MSCSSSTPTGNYCFGQLMLFRDTRLNNKSDKRSASYNTNLMGTLTTIKAEAQDQNFSAANCPTNAGGPGDKVVSVPTKCCVKQGIKQRLVNKRPGVDQKHGSYTRYLARKKGSVLKKQEC